MPKKKFKLSKLNPKDERGTVGIFIGLKEHGRAKKGNINKSLTVYDAKVSEVYAALLEILGE